VSATRLLYISEALCVAARLGKKQAGWRSGVSTVTLTPRFNANIAVRT